MEAKNTKTRMSVRKAAPEMSKEEEGSVFIYDKRISVRPKQRLPLLALPEMVLLLSLTLLISFPLPVCRARLASHRSPIAATQLAALEPTHRHPARVLVIVSCAQDKIPTRSSFVYS